MLKRRPRTSPPRAKSGRPPQSWTTPATTDLFRTIAGLKSLEETERFFRDLCTIPELHTLSHRWEVAKLLDQGVHYADIAERTGQHRDHHAHQFLAALRNRWLPAAARPAQGALKVNGRSGLIDGRLRLAIPNKGRLAEPAIALLREAGYQFEADDRRLFAPCDNYPLDLLFVRAEDIPEYTGDGVVDLGITGSNLVEERGSPVSQSMALGFGHCQLRVAVPDKQPFQQLRDLAGRPVATSHPRTTARFFKERNVAVELIEISGAVEITPLLGVADAIVDLVSTGSTLAVNGLRSIETILESEAQLISHPRLSPEKSERRRQLETMLASVIAARRKKYVMMNAPADALPLIKNVIPGMGSPTVMPLADPAMIAVHAVVDADAVWALLGPLKEAGATSILVMPIEKLIP